MAPWSRSRSGKKVNSEIRIIIADDHPIFRRGLRAVIQSDGAVVIVAEAETGDEALRHILEFEPDVAVLDVNMPVADGLAVARDIQARNLPTRIVFLTMYADEAIFNAALDADVCGFVIKDGAANDIVTCIKDAARGKEFFSETLADLAAKRRRGQRSPLEDLTASERRVLRLVADGHSTREIAAELFISSRTVDHHRANVAAKLGLRGKTALLTYAINNKLAI